MEIWKDIEGYEGLYQVSNLGNVKSLARPKRSQYSYQEIILKQGLNHQGYLLVKLCKNGKVRTKRVNRLVAEAFIPNPKNKEQVNHKNKLKTDNRAKNLEWMTPKENINYSLKKIKQYTKDNVFMKLWDSVLTITEETNINGGNIVKCCKGKRKTAGGYKWEYLEKEIM